MNSLKYAIYTSIFLHFARNIVNKGGHRDRTKAHKLTGSYSDESPALMFQMDSGDKPGTLFFMPAGEIAREIDRETMNCIKLYATGSDIRNGLLRCEMHVNPHIKVDNIRLSTRICGNEVTTRILPPDIRAATRPVYANR